MSDALLNTFIRYGTNAERLAFTPDPPVVSGSPVQVLYEWRETDTGNTYAYDTAWHLLASAGGGGITQLTGDVTAGPGAGSQASTIANSAVTTAKVNNSAITYAKIQDVSAASELLGRGSAAGAGAVQEITLGSGLSMSGTTLSATGTGGTVTTTGSPASGNLTKFSGAASITNGDLSGDVSTSGTLATTIGALKVATGMIQASAVTYAKIQNVSANSVLLGAGAAGSGAAPSEIALGSGLSMSGTTLSATGSGGTVTTTGSPASGNLTKFSGASSITNGDLSGDISTSGTLVTTIGALKVATGMVQASAITYAKIQNVSANSVLLGSSATGSGAAPSEITLGTNLSMSGSTLNATGGGGSGTVTHTAGALTAQKIIMGNGSADIAVASGSVAIDSGTLTLGAGDLKLTNGGSKVRFDGGAGTVTNDSQSSSSSLTVSTANINGSDTANIIIQTGSIASFGGNPGSVTIDTGSTNSGTSKNVILGGNGLVKYAGTNTTGAGSALLGTNSPAVTNTAPYTWFKMISSDGSTVYIPAWK